MNGQQQPVAVTYLSWCPTHGRRAYVEFLDDAAPKPNHMRCGECEAYCSILTVKGKKVRDESRR